MKLLVACALLLAFPVSAQQTGATTAPPTTTPGTPSAPGTPGTPGTPAATVPTVADTVLAPAANATAPVVNATAPAANATLPAAAVNATANVTNSTLAAASLPPDSQGCKITCRRREIRNLSAAERTAFFNAIKKLMEGAAPTKYDQLVKQFMDNVDGAHNCAYFAPWNRAFLRLFERALQEIDATVCLPYWNWSVDSQAPENSPIFSADYYGGNGGSGGCVANGPFASWKPAYPQPHCLQRKFKYTDNLGAFHSIEGINKMVTSGTNYDAFRGKLETLVAAIPHVNVGGDMAETYSPNDPLFWVHRAYVDYIWSQWQVKHKGGDFGGSNGSGGKAAPGDALKGLAYVVSDVLDSSKACYTYADMDDSDLADPALPPPQVDKPQGGAKPQGVTVSAIPDDDNAYAPNDRTRLNTLRHPDQADDAYCSKFKYDVAQVRSYEDEYKQTYTSLNKIKGYTSPCSLWKRPSLCRPILAKKTPMCVDVPDYGEIKVDYTDSDPYQAFSDVRQKTLYTSSEVELPSDSYKNQLQGLVGPSAFGGAGTLKKIVDEMDVTSPSGAAPRAAATALGMGVALLLPMAMLLA